MRGKKCPVFLKLGVDKPCQMLYYMQAEQSVWRSRVAGRARTIGNRVYPKRVSRVQIPPSPPTNKNYLMVVLIYFVRYVMGFEPI